MDTQIRGIESRIHKKKKSRNKPMLTWSFTLINTIKETRICNGEKIVPSTNGVRKTGQIHAKESK